MTDIRIEMNWYSVPREWVVMVLYNNSENESASINWYFKNKNKASKQLATLENQYGLKGIVNK